MNLGVSVNALRIVARTGGAPSRGLCPARAASSRLNPNAFRDSIAPSRFLIPGGAAEGFGLPQIAIIEINSAAMQGSWFFVEKTKWKWSERWVDGMAAVSGAPAGAGISPTNR
jgi:hypothetical protein